MLAVLLIALFTWIASGVGQTLLRPIRVLRARPLERFVFGAAIGLGIAAYGVFLLGVCGALSAWPVGIWWFVLCVAGLPGMMVQISDLRRWLRRRDTEPKSSSPRWENLLAGVSVGILILLGMISVIASFQPPGALEWDVLSYHLADPKVFLGQHRIGILPTEHHSNFPFTVEMLF